VQILAALVFFVFQAPSSALASYCYPPDQPYNVEASQGSVGGDTSRIRLWWDHYDPDWCNEGFVIYRDTHPGTVCATGDIIYDPYPGPQDPWLNWFDDYYATPGVIYFYSVQAWNYEGWSPCSDEFSGYREVPSIHPPNNVSATDGTFSDRVRVSWSLPNVEHIDSFTLYRSTSPGSSCQHALQTGISKYTQTYDDFSAAAGVTYYYSMKSFGPYGASSCSNIDPGFRMNVPVVPNPPLNVSASDGTFEDKVRVTWNIPGGPAISGFKLFRSNSYASCSGSPIAGSIGAGTTSYNDFNVTPGVTYYYSMKSFGPGGTSGCSNVDSGFADGPQLPLPPANVDASFDTFSDRVRVQWSTVGLDLDDINTYTLYRSTNPNSQCVDPLFTGISKFTQTRDDFSAIAGVTYYYSMKSFGPAGASSCSNVDAGRRVAAIPERPINVQASDGTFTEFVRVTWNISGTGPAATGFRVLRNDGSSGILFQLSGDLAASARSFDDTSAVPGVVYTYAVEAFNNSGTSLQSTPDDGFRDTIDPDPNPDCDGDGVSDAQEIIDGTEVCDPGSFQLHLQSPAFAKYNTFYDQNNYLELTASGTEDILATITVYDIEGLVRAQSQVFIPSLEQRDVDLNVFVGQKDTYGLIRIDFDDETVGSTLIGRVANYRSDGLGGFSFAFAKELRNATRGPVYGTANTFDPQGLGFLVPNWLEIMNLDNVSRTFSVNLFSQEGALLRSRVVTVPPRGERDIDAGHSFGQGVYLIEVIPFDGASRYFARVTRYSSNSANASADGSFNFAFPIDAKAGNGAEQFAQTSNTVGATWGQLNWLEVVNTRPFPVTASVEFRDQNGALRGASNLNLDARAQFHFNTSLFVDKGFNGSAKISGNQPGSLLAQSLIYFQDSAANNVQTAYASEGRIPGRDVVIGTYNTFLNIQNLVAFVATSSSSTTADLEVRRNGLLLSDTTQFLLPGENLQTNVSNSLLFNTTADSNGVLRVQTPEAMQVLVENVRFREANGKADFAIPTAVQ